LSDVRLRELRVGFLLLGLERRLFFSNRPIAVELGLMQPGNAAGAVLAGVGLQGE
jgi:hypothetical protein